MIPDSMFAKGVHVTGCSLPAPQVTMNQMKVPDVRCSGESGWLVFLYIFLSLFNICLIHFMHKILSMFLVVCCLHFFLQVGIQLLLHWILVVLFTSVFFWYDDVD